MILEGNAHVFGDHINTDYIISSKVKSQMANLDEMTEHVMEDIRPGFYRQIQRGDFIVAGINYGCGSSRETAPWVIKNAGISAVLAKSFARIFFRNAINIGLNVLRLDTSSIRQGDRLKIDLVKGQVENLTLGGEALHTQALPDFIQKILGAGGIKEYFKAHGDFDL